MNALHVHQCARCHVTWTCEERRYAPRHCNAWRTDRGEIRCASCKGLP